MKYISKFKYDYTPHGYQVRLPEIENGSVVQFQGENYFFTKSKYRTWKRCLEAAVEFRDKYLRKYKALHLLKSHGFTGRGRSQYASNTSGVVGVSCIVQINESGTYITYVATWCEDRKQRKKHFSVTSLGKKDAFLAACRLRYEKKGTLNVTNKKALPCKPDVPYQ